MIDAPDTGSHRQRARLLIAILLCLLFVAAAWRWSPLPAYLDVGADDFLHLLERLRQLPILAIVMVMLASIVAIPLGLIIVAGVLVFGPLYGAVYILVGRNWGRWSVFRLANTSVIQPSIFLPVNGSRTSASAWAKGDSFRFSSFE